MFGLSPRLSIVAAAFALSVAACASSTPNDAPPAEQRGGTQAHATSPPATTSEQPGSMRSVSAADPSSAATLPDGSTNAVQWADATADVLNRPATGDPVAHAYQSVRALPRRARADGGEQWRAQLRATLADQLALGSETRLRPVIRPLDSVVGPNDVTVTRYQYLREPGLYAELVRLEPRERRADTPILLLPGHGDAGRDAMLGANTGAADTYQAGAAVALAEAGYAVYVTELRSLETATPYPLGHLAFVRMMIAEGRTALGVFVADTVQAAAVVEQVEADASEGVVVAGVSLGAMVAVLAGQQLPNVTGVVAAGYLGTMDGRYLAGHSCTCVYVPGIAGIADVPDVMGALAPTPLAVVMGAQDEYYPLADQEAAWPSLVTAYDGEGGRVQLFRHEGAHTWGDDTFLDAVGFVMPTE